MITTIAYLYIAATVGWAPNAGLLAITAAVDIGWAIALVYLVHGPYGPESVDDGEEVQPAIEEGTDSDWGSEEI